jgi:hypothetical protein
MAGAGARGAFLQERLDKIEDMLVGGVPAGQVDRRVAREYGITVRQAQRLRAKLYERWDTETLTDAPHRRETLIRMGERFYAKCVAADKYTAGAQMFGHLARMSGAFAHHDPARDARLVELGPPPSDPTQMLVWAQRGMAFGLWEVLNHPSIEPERRIRLITDIGAKLGMTHAKALVQARLAEVAGRVFGGVETPSDALAPIADAEWYDPPGSGGGDDAGDAPPRHGPGAPPGEDG